MQPLTPPELRDAVIELSNWRLAEGKLIRDREFPGFLEAIAFVNRIAQLAEQQNHHPDIDIRYNKVRLGLVTHDADGITRHDLRLASLIDSIDG